MFWNERLARRDPFWMRTLVAKAEHLPPKPLSRKLWLRPYESTTLLLILATPVPVTQGAASWILVSRRLKTHLCLLHNSKSVPYDVKKCLMFPMWQWWLVCVHQAFKAIFLKGNCLMVNGSWPPVKVVCRIGRFPTFQCRIIIL